MPTWNSLDTLAPFFASQGLLGYLDPGTGSYALQLLLAGAFGGLFALKQSWQQVRTWLVQVRVGRRVSATPLEGAD